MLSRRNLVFLLLLLLAGTRLFHSYWPAILERTGPATGLSVTEAFQRKLSDIQVEGSGTVIKLLTDDLQGSRHQRFILRTGPGQTVLIAHNIDLAPRLPNLQTGNELSFYGEYVWNDKGGVVHWTHHDPRGKHPSGWLRFNGRIYQ